MDKKAQKKGEKETCKGCKFMEKAKGIKMFRCQVWDKLVFPNATEACIYKHYRKEEEQ